MRESLSTSIGRPRRSLLRLGGRRHAAKWLAAPVAVAAIAAATACSDTAVPFFDSPTNIPNSTTGIQNAVTGLISASRLDVQWYVYDAGSFGRDIFWFLGASSNVLTDPGGLIPGNNTSITAIEAWDNEYAQIKQANNILTQLPTIQGYTAQQDEAIWGIVQTVKAVNFMILAETRDTLGIPLYSVGANSQDGPYCNQDVWQYIVALLDSANDSLTVAGANPLPVHLPPGFGAVNATAAPSTSPGAFAAFNRALAGKAGLEYAYAKARSNPATMPTLNTPGTLDATILNKADADLTSSALYNTAVIAPPAAGNFPLDQYGVYHTFSGQSGDLQNGFVGSFFLYDALWDLQNDVDTLNDLRWKAKFVDDPQNIQLAAYAGTSDAKNFLPYKNPDSPIPIVRAEELALVRAQIQLGLGNLAAAANLVNIVHTQAGGMPALTINTGSYTAVRDSLLKEQRISTVYEGSGDRMISLRMYKLEAVADTTWQAHSGPDAVVDAGLGSPTDFHTTIAPIPEQELLSRSGQWTPKCP